jgi:hypothetical protein
MAIVTSSAFRRAILVWALPFVSGYTIRLFTNNYIPLYNSQSTDFVEPLGAWYTPQAIGQFHPPSNLSSGQSSSISQLITWTVTSDPRNESAYGYWVTTSTGLYAWAQQMEILQPVPLSSLGAKVSLIPRLDAGALC